MQWLEIFTFLCVIMNYEMMIVMVLSCLLCLYLSAMSGTLLKMLYNSTESPWVMADSKLQYSVHNHHYNLNFNYHIYNLITMILTKIILTLSIIIFLEKMWGGSAKDFCIHTCNLSWWMWIFIYIYLFFLSKCKSGHVFDEQK